MLGRDLGRFCITPHLMAGCVSMKRLNGSFIKKTLHNPTVSQTLSGIETLDSCPHLGKVGIYLSCPCIYSFCELSLMMEVAMEIMLSAFFTVFLLGMVHLPVVVMTWRGE